MRIAKIASGLAIASLLLGGSAALAQTTDTNYNNTNGTMQQSQSTQGTGTGGIGGAGDASQSTLQGTTTPGAPNTGAGGDPTSTALLIGVAALVVLGGLAYLAYRASAPQT